MKLPDPTPKYDQPRQRLIHHALEQADAHNRKKEQDIEVHPARLILRSPDGTRYEVRVSDAGALTADVIAGPAL